MEIILHLTVIIVAFYILKRQVWLRIARQVVHIYAVHRAFSIGAIREQDAVYLLKLRRLRDRKLKEAVPWLEK